MSEAKRKFAWMVGVLAFGVPILMQAIVVLGTGRTRVLGEPLRLGQLVITAMPIVATELAEALLARARGIDVRTVVLGTVLIASGAGLAVLLLVLNEYQPSQMTGGRGLALLTVQIIYAIVAYNCAQELHVSRRP